MNVLKYVYDVVRPLTPRSTATYAGVESKQARLFDRDEHPKYKRGLIEAIRNHAPAAHVEIVGFGWGISTVVALQAGADHVTGYEAAESQCELGIDTLGRNGVDTDKITVYHAVIGEAINVFGEAAGAPKCGPDVLGAGDVLVLDSEGAEAGILRGLESDYHAIIVEDHPNQGTKAERLAQHLPTYETQIREYQPDNEDKSVLVATREQ